MGNFKMRNKILTMTAATVLTVTICIPSFAGQWNDGKCYYFTPDGYCLINTVTPDGYTVNGDGAWTVNDVIQTQTNETSTSLQTWVCSLDYYDGPDGTDPYFGVQIGNSEDSLPDIYQLYDPTGSIPYTIKNKPEWVAYWDVQIVGEIYDGSNGPAIKVHQLTVIQ